MVNSGAQEGRVVGVNARKTESGYVGAEEISLLPQSPCVVPELNPQRQNLEEPVLERVPTQLEMFNQLREMQSRMKSVEDELVDYKKVLERRSVLKRKAINLSGPSKKHKEDKGKSKVDNCVRWCCKCRSKHAGECTSATMRCNRCGELGHAVAGCKNQVKCFNCQGSGHMSVGCPKPKVELKSGNKKAKIRMS